MLAIAGTSRLLDCTTVVAAQPPRPSERTETQSQKQSASERIQFNRDVRPILADKCYACHGPDEATREAGLRLDTLEGAMSDLGGYQAIEPGAPERSELIQRIFATDDSSMPPPEHPKQLSPDERATLKQWIAEGAKWQSHWAYLPPVQSQIPGVDPAAKVANFIDAYVLEKLAAEQIEPSREADKAVLLRRLSFDLIGLPPTYAEVEAFVTDDSESAYEKVVDRLLRSPHYGERLAMYWLDLVRYADSVGYHGDQDVSVSPYRDYVIDAFNSNMSFRQFTREQLAGDLLPEPTTQQLIASGYNKLGMMSAEGGVQPEEYLVKYAADRVRNASTVWLGATLGCAECHDHKFDPFTAQDFYRFAAFFADLEERGLYSGPDTPDRWGPIVEIPSDDLPEMLASIDAEISALEAAEPSADDVADAEASEGEQQAEPSGKPELTAVQRKLEELQQRRQTIVASNTRTSLISVSVPPREIRVLHRGNWMDKSGAVVQPGVPHFLPQVNGDARQADERLGRLELADWITAEANPLTARVFVNRLWKLYFGTGLSKVLDDLGTQGELPTHPELLDRLALEFVDSGWDVKHVVKLMVMSHTYRQSSLPRPELKTRDPYNRLLARQSRFRLDAELVRDNALAVSGLLVAEVGGRSAKPYQPEGLYRHLNFPPREYQADDDANQYRRGVYTHWQRQFLHPAMQAMDAPAREECTAERPRSNTPLAALVLLNDPSYVEAARVFAARAMEQTIEPKDRMQWMMRTALSRVASARELRVLRGLLDSELQVYEREPDVARAFLKNGLSPVGDEVDPVQLAAWSSVARALLNMHESVTRN